MSLNSPEYLKKLAEITQAESDLAKLNLKLDEISADTALMAGGFLPPPAGTAADIVSLGRSLGAGDWGGAFWDAVGIIPIVGDGAKVAAKGSKLANKAADIKKALEKANAAIQKKKDELAELCNKNRVAKKDQVTNKAENCAKGDCAKKPPKQLKKTDVPCFKKNKKGDPKEFDRQLKDQEDGLNNLTAEEYLKGRAAYSTVNRKSTVRARIKYKNDLIKNYTDSGMKKTEATKLAESKMETLNALHNPDMIAGGKDVTTNFGDQGVNKSIGSQWRTRVDELDKEAKEAVKQGQSKAKMNVKLNRCP
ncbi:MAG: hypothetical protein CTY18_10730 [Methylomonas sp.]|nr:MAG: hypothetical protein CTY24_12420 [Methylobacter sp.]PPD32285.1 MAG: hypothetical protein CTY18_10730 [Methylomonas sp.]